MKPLLGILHSAFGCYHRQISRVFTIRKRTYRVCFQCGKESEYFLGFDAFNTVECCRQRLCTTRSCEMDRGPGNLSLLGAGVVILILHM